MVRSETFISGEFCCDGGYTGGTSDRGFGIEMPSEKVINVKDYKLTVRSSLLLFTSVSYRQQRNSSSYLAGWSGDSRLYN